LGRLSSVRVVEPSATSASRRFAEVRARSSATGRRRDSHVATTGAYPSPLDEALDERRRLELRVAADERGVAPAGSDQLLVATPFHDVAAVEDDDLVGVPDGREPVRDRNRRPPLRQLIERLLHEALGLRVERR